VYDLEILVNNIEDRADNATRFLVVGRNLLAASGNDKTTLLVSTSDTAGGAGVLHHLLKPLADHQISMTRIESRPSRRKNWDYVFFIDIDGHAEESPAVEALAELKERSSLFRVLGAYPKAVD
jgi:chorismate mutase/prephenate dehydratase